MDNRTVKTSYEQYRQEKLRVFQRTGRQPGLHVGLPVDRDTFVKLQALVLRRA